MGALAERLGVPVQDIAKLDGNENPYGPSPRVAAALASGDAYQFYYDADQTDLRRWISQYAGLPPEYVMAGNGADELIDLLMKLISTPATRFWTSNHPLGCTPSMPSSTMLGWWWSSGTSVGRSTSTQALAALTPRTKIVMLTSPNNPTGNVISPDQLGRLLRRGHW